MLSFYLESRIIKQNAALRSQGEEELDKDVLNVAYRTLSERFDEQYAGFASAPKFPTPHNLTFLLRYWKRTGDEKALNMVEKTLRSMRLGGVYDHVGFGFHRYSTDRKWLVPHFEKMLYDQAMLIIAYVEAYQATKKEEYRQTAQEIFTYVLRDMTAPESGFYSAEDAESVLLRKKEIYDGATPSGNSVAMLDLLLLGRMTANPEYEEKADLIARAFSRDVLQSPLAYTQLMTALDFELGNPYEIVLVGNSKSDDTKAMLKALRERFIPNKVVVLRPTEVDSPEIVRFANYTRDMSSMEGKATAYVCQNYSCKQPTTDIEEMLELFDK